VGENITAKEVAALTEVSQSTMGNWLRGKNFQRPDPWNVRDFHHL
jgi:transcriptional regulator with XRE-family HTH domain